MGCCASIHVVPVEKSTVSTSAPTLQPASTSKPTRLLSQVENVENFVLVWLDTSADNNKKIQESIHELQKRFNTVKIFSKVEECYTYLKNNTRQKIFLIVSDTLERQFVPIIQELTQMSSVYIFSLNNQTHDNLSTNLSNVHGRYTSLTSLSEKLDKDIKKCDHNLVGFEVVAQANSQTMTNPNQQEATFMYDQLFWEIIFDMEDNDMTDMYEFFESIYHENKKEMKFLTELKKDYLKQSPIYWYSRDNFLYRELNDALREHRYETLYIMRVFIRHLHEKIVEQHKQDGLDVLTLYRGQQMEQAKFKRFRESEGGLMCFSSFLSTTTNRAVALEFAGDPIEDSINAHILFEIIVDKTTSTHFVDIRKISCYEEEAEWLFTVGSVFRIGSIKYQPDKIWHINLILTDDDDKQLAVLRNHFRNSMQDKNLCLRLAALMSRLGNWKQATYFYLLALQTETEWQRRAIILNNLGLVKMELEQYDEAIKYFQESLALKEKHGGSDNKDIASSYNNIGTVYHKQKQMDLAIKNFEQALEFSKKTGNDNQEFMATLHHNIGTILNGQGKHEEALKNNEKCLDIQLNIFPPNHPNLAVTYGSIATTHHFLRSSSKALEYAQKAIEIDKQTLPPEHSQTKFHEQNLQVFKQQLESSKSNT